jgi:hypothetical protein
VVTSWGSAHDGGPARSDLELPAFSETILHTEPVPAEPLGMVVAPVLQERRPADCSNAEGSHRDLDPSSLRVKATIVGRRRKVALMSAPSGHTRTVRVGDYLGSNCWRVSEIRSEYVVIARAPDPAAQSQRLVTARLRVNDGPRPDLAQR